MHPRILIVGTVPYNKKMSSRAFDAYFHNWEKENLAQIFSNTKEPVKGHCGTLYQITDHQMLMRWLKPKTETGRIFRYDELCEEGETDRTAAESEAIQKAYRFGRKHTAFTHLLRGLLWRKRFWCTEKLNRWLDAFQPECVFLSFSDDYFIPQIALYVAKRYNIPIVSSIGDDYYFNKRFSLSPLYHLYKDTYKALIRKVMGYKGSAIYISDKIRDKYNAAFNHTGETVYLTSECKRTPFKTINTEKPLITYFGNIRMGRNHSLNHIGEALGALNPSYVLEVYSNESDPEYYQVFDENPHVKYCGSVPYSVVREKMESSDITVIVEGFAEKDISLSRYSLSTKAADALASGVAILTYGSQECGVVEYMQSTNASMVCTNKKELTEAIQTLMQDQDLQKKYYDQAILMTEQHHNLKKSCTVFEAVVHQAIEGAN